MPVTEFDDWPQRAQTSLHLRSSISHHGALIVATPRGNTRLLERYP